MFEKKSKKKIHDWTGNLEPAAIQFTLERLQESARRLGCLLEVLSFYRTSV